MSRDSEIADALRDVLVSPNVADSNMEAANIVDVLASLGKAIRYAGLVIGPGAGNGQFGGLQELSSSLIKSAEIIGAGLSDVAEAIRDLRNRHEP